MQQGVTVVYHGHACFSVKGSDGKTVVIDPFDETVGYPVPQLEADVVLATHDHFDHANVSAVKCDREAFIARQGPFEAAGIKFVGIKAPHWTEPQFKARGDVVIYRWEQDGVALCHLGDLGQVLTDEQVAELQPVDVLMVPVGGNYTIGPEQAVQVIKQLRPKIVIPMHYKTAYTSPSLQLGTIADFLKAVPEGWQVRREAGNFVFIGPDQLRQAGEGPVIWILNP